MWFQLFMSYDEDPEVPLDLMSNVLILLYGFDHIWTQNLKYKAIKHLR